LTQGKERRGKRGAVERKSGTIYYVSEVRRR